LRFWARRIAYHLAGSATARTLSSLAMDQLDQRIIAETARYRITGMLRLPSEGYRSRLTDYLNSPDRSFLPLTDVEISRLDDHDPRASERRSFIALSLAHVVLAMPADGEPASA